MGNPSRRYTAEFKQKAVGLYRKSGTTYAEVARGLSPDAARAAYDRLRQSARLAELPGDLCVGRPPLVVQPHGPLLELGRVLG